MNVSVSTKNGLFDMGGFTFRLNGAGIVYQANPGGGGDSWGLYGVISLNNRSPSLKLGDQGVSVGVSRESCKPRVEDHKRLGRGRR